MLASAFLAVLACMGISFLLCLFGTALTFRLQGPEMARGLFQAWIFNFNGLLVGGTTWAVAYLVYHQGKAVLGKMLALLDIDLEESARVLHSFSRAYSWKRLLTLSLPLGGIGMWSLWKCGYPLEGFAQAFLFVGSGSLHLSAAFILVFLYYTTRFFMTIELNPSGIRIKQRISPLELESFNTFFIVTATLGILAAYFAIRGTLTAGFRLPDPLFGKLLIYPVIVYLPIGLMYSFYPRYVLKRLNDRSLVSELDGLEGLRKLIETDSAMGLEQKLKMQSALAELREKLRNEMKQFPILDIKDYPSLLLLILMFIQYVVLKDTVVAKFLNTFKE